MNTLLPFSEFFELSPFKKLDLIGIIAPGWDALKEPVRASDVKYLEYLKSSFDPYNQTTEFEGFVQCGDSDKWYKYKDLFFIELKAGYDFVEIEESIGILLTKMPTPKTMGDWITVCRTVGIELRKKTGN